MSLCHSSLLLCRSCDNRCNLFVCVADYTGIVSVVVCVVAVPIVVVVFVLSVLLLVLALFVVVGAAVVSFVVVCLCC